MKVRRPPDSARQLNYKRIRDRIVQTLRGVVRNRTFPQRTRPQFLRLLWRVRHDGHPLRLGQSLAKGRCMQAEISPDGEQYLTPCTCDSKFFEGKHPALPELASSLFPQRPLRASTSSRRVLEPTRTAMAALLVCTLSRRNK